MSTPVVPNTNEVQVAELKLAKAQAIAEAVKLASLFAMSSVIISIAMMTHQSADTVQTLGFFLFCLGAIGLYLM